MNSSAAQYAACCSPQPSVLVAEGAVGGGSSVPLRPHPNDPPSALVGHAHAFSNIFAAVPRKEEEDGSARACSRGWALLHAPLGVGDEGRRAQGSSMSHADEGRSVATSTRSDDVSLSTATSGLGTVSTNTACVMGASVNDHHHHHQAFSPTTAAAMPVITSTAPRSTITAHHYGNGTVPMALGGGGPAALYAMTTALPPTLPATGSGGLVALQYPSVDDAGGSAGLPGTRAGAEGCGGVAMLRHRQAILSGDTFSSSPYSGALWPGEGGHGSLPNAAAPPFGGVPSDEPPHQSEGIVAQQQQPLLLGDATAATSACYGTCTARARLYAQRRAARALADSSSTDSVIAGGPAAAATGICLDSASVVHLMQAHHQHHAHAHARAAQPNGVGLPGAGRSDGVEFTSVGSGGRGDQPQTSTDEGASSAGGGSSSLSPNRRRLVATLGGSIGGHSMSATRSVVQPSSASNALGGPPQPSRMAAAMMLMSASPPMLGMAPLNLMGVPSPHRQPFSSPLTVTSGPPHGALGGSIATEDGGDDSSSAFYHSPPNPMRRGTTIGGGEAFSSSEGGDPPKEEARSPPPPRATGNGVAVVGGSSGFYPSEGPQCPFHSPPRPSSVAYDGAVAMAVLSSPPPLHLAVGSGVGGGASALPPLMPGRPVSGGTASMVALGSAMGGAAGPPSSVGTGGVGGASSSVHETNSDVLIGSGRSSIGTPRSANRGPGLLLVGGSGPHQYGGGGIAVGGLRADQPLIEMMTTSTVNSGGASLRNVSFGNASCAPPRSGGQSPQPDASLGVAGQAYTMRSSVTSSNSATGRGIAMMHRIGFDEAVATARHIRRARTLSVDSSSARGELNGSAVRRASRPRGDGDAPVMSRGNNPPPPSCRMVYMRQLRRGSCYSFVTAGDDHDGRALVDPPDGRGGLFAFPSGAAQPLAGASAGRRGSEGSVQGSSCVVTEGTMTPPLGSLSSVGGHCGADGHIGGVGHTPTMAGGLGRPPGPVPIAGQPVVLAGGGLAGAQHPFLNGGAALVGHSHSHSTSGWGRSGVLMTEEQRLVFGAALLHQLPHHPSNTLATTASGALPPPPASSAAPLNVSAMSEASPSLHHLAEPIAVSQQATEECCDATATTMASCIKGSAVVPFMGASQSLVVHGGGGGLSGRARGHHAGESTVFAGSVSSRAMAGAHHHHQQHEGSSFRGGFGVVGPSDVTANLNRTPVLNRRFLGAGCRSSSVPLPPPFTPGTAQRLEAYRQTAAGPIRLLLGEDLVVMPTACGDAPSLNYATASTANSPLTVLGGLGFSRVGWGAELTSPTRRQHAANNCAHNNNTSQRQWSSAGGGLPVSAGQAAGNSFRDPSVGCLPDVAGQRASGGRLPEERDGVAVPMGGGVDAGGRYYGVFGCDDAEPMLTLYDTSPHDEGSATAGAKGGPTGPHGFELPVSPPRCPPTLCDRIGGRLSPGRAAVPATASSSNNPLMVMSGMGSYMYEGDGGVPPLIIEGISGHTPSQVAQSGPPRASPHQLMPGVRVEESSAPAASTSVAQGVGEALPFSGVMSCSASGSQYRFTNDSIILFQQNGAVTPPRLRNATAGAWGSSSGRGASGGGKGHQGLSTKPNVKSGGAMLLLGDPLLAPVEGPQRSNGGGGNPIDEGLLDRWMNASSDNGGEGGAARRRSGGPNAGGHDGSPSSQVLANSDGHIRVPHKAAQVLDANNCFVIMGGSGMDDEDALNAGGGLDFNGWRRDTRGGGRAAVGGRRRAQSLDSITDYLASFVPLGYAVVPTACGGVGGGAPTGNGGGSPAMTFLDSGFSGALVGPAFSGMNQSGFQSSLQSGGVVRTSSMGYNHHHHTHHNTNHNSAIHPIVGIVPTRSMRSNEGRPTPTAAVSGRSLIQQHQQHGRPQQQQQQGSGWGGSVASGGAAGGSDHSTRPSPPSARPPPHQHLMCLGASAYAACQLMGAAGAHPVTVAAAATEGAMGRSTGGEAEAGGESLAKPRRPALASAHTEGMSHPYAQRRGVGGAIAVGSVGQHAPSPQRGGSLASGLRCQSALPPPLTVRALSRAALAAVVPPSVAAVGSDGSGGGSSALNQSSSGYAPTAVSTAFGRSPIARMEHDLNDDRGEGGLYHPLFSDDGGGSSSGSAGADLGPIPVLSVTKNSINNGNAIAPNSQFRTAVTPTFLQQRSPRRVGGDYSSTSQSSSPQQQHGPGADGPESFHSLLSHLGVKHDPFPDHVNGGGGGGGGNPLDDCGERRSGVNTTQQQLH